MKIVIHEISLFFVVVGITLVPYSASAEGYSSEYTRKWAAQREAAQEAARQREQQYAERQLERQKLGRMLNQVFNIEAEQGGTDINSTPERRRPQSPAPEPADIQRDVDYGNSIDSNQAWECGMGILGTVGDDCQDTGK